MQFGFLGKLLLGEAGRCARAADSLTDEFSLSRWRRHAPSGKQEGLQSNTVYSLLFVLRCLMKMHTDAARLGAEMRTDFQSKMNVGKMSHFLVCRFAGRVYNRMRRVPERLESNENERAL
jgi:hypothetical protein